MEGTKYDLKQRPEGNVMEAHARMIMHYIMLQPKFECRVLFTHCNNSETLHLQKSITEIPQEGIASRRSTEQVTPNGNPIFGLKPINRDDHHKGLH